MVVFCWDCVIILGSLILPRQCTQWSIICCLETPSLDFKSKAFRSRKAVCDFETFRLLWSGQFCVWMIPSLTHHERANAPKVRSIQALTNRSTHTCTHPELEDRLLWQEMWFIMAATTVLSSYIREQRRWRNATHYVTHSDAMMLVALSQLTWHHKLVVFILILSSGILSYLCTFIYKDRHLN